MVKIIRNHCQIAIRSLFIMTPVDSLSNCLRDIGGPNDDVEQELDDFLQEFVDNKELVKVEERSSSVDRLHSALIASEFSSLQADIMHNNIVHCLSMVSWKEIHISLSKSIDNTSVKVHESGSIPSLLDFSALSKLNVDPEYVAIVSYALLACLYVVM